MLCLFVGCGAEPTATNMPRHSTDPPAFTGSGRIAFTSDRDATKEIYVMDSSGLTRLTDNPATDRWPAWSPDGTRMPSPPPPVPEAWISNSGTPTAAG